MITSLNHRCKCIWPLVIGCIGCDTTETIPIEKDVHTISIDVSQSVAFVMRSNGPYPGINVATSSGHESINYEYLASLVQGMDKDRAHFISVLPSADADMRVFYAAHNGKKRTQVMLRLLAEEGVTINGNAHNAAIELSAGAHGFQVASEDAPIRVEHVFVPLQ